MFSCNSLFRRRSVSSVLIIFAISVFILGFLSLYAQLKYSANVHFDFYKDIRSSDLNDEEQVHSMADMRDQVLGRHQRPCQMDSCFNYSICPIFTEISYNLLACDKHRENDSLCEALNSSSAQVIPSKSPCLTILVLSRCRNDTPELNEYLSKEKGTKIFNDLIFLNCPEENSDWESALFALRKIRELKKAIVVSPFASTFGFAKGFDIVSTFFGERSTSVLDVSDLERNILINFDETCRQHHNHSIFLLKKGMEEQQHTTPVSAIFACDRRACDSNYCTKCDGDQDYALRHSIFTVISLPKDTAVLSTLQLQQKLFQILQYGSVPVVIGPRFLPPFEEIIDWGQVLVRIPEPRIMHIPEILTSYSQVVRDAMRHQGGLVLNQHFRTLSSVITATFSVISSRLSFAGIYYVPEKPKLIQSFSGSNSTVEIQPGLTISNQKPPTTTWFVPEPILRTTTPLWAQSSYQQGYKSTNHISVTQDQFTIVILTFNRVKELKKLLVYLNGLTQVHKIIVAWSSQIPKNITWWPKNLTIPIHAIQANNSLNSRFFPFEAIETDAVLSLDDDMYVSHADLLLGFRVWQENQNRLVGYPGRNALSKDGKKWIYDTKTNCPASIILTSCAFIHKMYLVYYTFQMPDSIRQTVDKLMNCEDIAMNFLVSHLSQKPPIKVTNRKYFSCSRCPSLARHSLSYKKGHLKKRSLCITEFTKVYGYTPLINTHVFLKNDSFGVLPGCL